MTRFLITWGPAATWAAVLFLLSELPPDFGGGGLGVNDKVVHAGIYAVLGGALAWAGARSGRMGALGLIVLGLTYGALDEWHQGFVPGRDPSLGDFLADCLGVAVGFLLLRFILRAVRQGPLEEPN